MEEQPYKLTDLRRDSQRPIYAPFPVFLMDFPLSMTARVLYAHLLNRAMLTQRNDWVDADGRVFIIFPEAEMCSILRKGLTSVKNALNDLQAAGLLSRERTGLGKANRIFLRIAVPVDEKPPDSMDEKLLVGRTESTPSVSRFPDGQTDGKLTPSNNTNEYHPERNTEKTGEQTAYGCYENIFLQPQELEMLHREYPDSLDRYLDEMSRYLAAHGL